MVQEMEEAAYPEGLVVFVKGINIAASRSTVRALLADVIKLYGGGLESESIAYLDHDKGLDSVRSLL